MNFRPKNVEFSLTDQVLEILWSDDHKSVFPLYGLRKNCPCVICRGGHAHMGDFEPEAFLESDPPKMGINGIEQIGNHAIQINWADGHNSGMYRWETLRMFGDFLGE